MSLQQKVRQPLGWPLRCALLVAAAGVLGLLWIAQRLDPDPRGYGTHTQLGLGPCVYLTTTGRVCPTCGMTTAYAWVVRGRLGRAWQANPAGCLFALLSVPLAAWLVVSAAKNEAVAFRSLEKPLAAMVVAAVVLGVGSWFIRMVNGPAIPVPPGQTPRPAVRAPGP